MRSVWIDEGTDPDYEKLAPYRFDVLFFSGRDPRATPAYLDKVRAKGYGIGIYWASTWDAGRTGADWAHILNTYWLGAGGATKLTYVQANIEEHDPIRVAQFLLEWRKLRPFAKTSWALEGFQGGWVVKIRDQVLASKVKLVPEAYDGDMVPFDPDGVIRDLTQYGFPRASIEVFHGAQNLLRGWDGFVFTSAKLP